MGCRPAQDTPDTTSEVVQAVNRGVGFMGQYLYDEAAQAFQKALTIDPALTDAKINLAIALFNRARKEDRDLDRAGMLLEEVLKQEPDNPRALYFQGIVFQHVGQAEAAIPCFEHIVELHPDDGVAWYLLGLCKQRLGQPAEVELQRAIELRPYLFSAYYKLFQLALARGDTDQAQAYLEEFKQLRENPLGEAIELPQYNQMGDLALVRPLATRNQPPIATSQYHPGEIRMLQVFDTAAELPSPVIAAVPPGSLSGAAAADLNQDGRIDLVVPLPGPAGSGRVALLLGEPNGGFVDASGGSGLGVITTALTCAVGDYDNDDLPDLYVGCAGPNYLLKGKGDGTFEDVTGPSGTGGGPEVTRSALFLDADHDADLDLFVCNAGQLGGPQTVGNQLWNNNADGTFQDIAGAAGVALADRVTVTALPGDLDGDRDMDLVLCYQDKPAQVFFNELLGSFRPSETLLSPARADRGAVLQDFNGDGQLDLVTLGGDPTLPRLFLGDGRGQLRPAAAFNDVSKSTASWGSLRGLRATDLDLDGDLDLALFGAAGHVLLNDGLGRFVLQPDVWPAPDSTAVLGVDLHDLTGDFVSDLLRLEDDGGFKLTLSPGQLSHPPTALAIRPTGLRGRDKRTRSPASGYGVSLALRSGWREQTRVHSGLNGGFNQSASPLVFGLGGAAQADYAQLGWTDGVAQVEMALAAGQTHKISEIQRKISSCPVLFAWNGERFEFITDFAGVGGLGYFVAPGEYASPQVLEHIKLEPHQLRPRQGRFELRICEPMEETAYIDRLELLAIDHPQAHPVYPDERLAVSGAPPTHQLLAVDHPLFPLKAIGPDQQDCIERLQHVDRRYAYKPELDQRFFGFATPHTLELDFGESLRHLRTTDTVHLFIHGFIEYPYSQTVYAASQARIGWEPIRVEGRRTDGTWQTLVPDAGVPGGMARMMTVDLTGCLEGLDGHLRLTTNLEIYYDQIFIGRHSDLEAVAVHPLPVDQARLRRVGFPREYSPDGRMPKIYDYDWREATAPFHVLRGNYTRYGSVTELLHAFDDQYVLVGPGDEIAAEFDASSLPPLPEGRQRSFILVSHAYCKDMDLYTATPETLAPLPFIGMSRYPYPATERYPNTVAHREYLETYNTRRVD